MQIIRCIFPLLHWTCKIWNPKGKYNNETKSMPQNVNNSKWVRINFYVAWFCGVGSPKLSSRAHCLLDIEFPEVFTNLLGTTNCHLVSTELPLSSSFCDKFDWCFLQSNKNMHVISKRIHQCKLFNFFLCLLLHETIFFWCCRISCHSDTFPN